MEEKERMLKIKYLRSLLRAAKSEDIKRDLLNQIRHLEDEDLSKLSILRKRIIDRIEFREEEMKILSLTGKTINRILIDELKCILDSEGV